MSNNFIPIEDKTTDEFLEKLKDKEPYFEPFFEDDTINESFSEFGRTSYKKTKLKYKNEK